MEYVYLIISLTGILLIFSIILVLFVKSISRRIFSTSKANLAKGFLTYCYKILLGVVHGTRSFRIATLQDEIILNFLNLLQKIFDGKVVVEFRSHQSKFFFNLSTKPFFPFISPISRLLQLLHKYDLSELVSESLLKSLEIENNKSRVSVPSDISVISLDEVVKICKEINVNTVIFVPIYRDTEILSIFLVFTNRLNVSEEAFTVSDILIDFISLFLLYLANRRSIEELLTKTVSGMITLGENVISCEILLDTRTRDVITTTCDEETLSQVFEVIDLEELVKNTEKLGFSRVLKNYETEDSQIFFSIYSECLRGDKIKVKVSKLRYRSLEKIEEILFKISDMIELPIVIVFSRDGRIAKLNEKFREIFGEYSTCNDLTTLMSEMKRVSEDVVVHKELFFRVKNIAVREIGLEGVFFYPLQVANQKAVRLLYDEATRVRKLVYSVNFYESNLVSKNLEVYARYQPSDELTEVGGDFFIIKDFGKKSAVGVFDVSGHGLSAGFLASNLKNILERDLAETKSIAKSIEELNNFVFSINEGIPDTDSYFYVTGILCEVDTEKMKLRLISAGHKYGIFLKENNITTLKDFLIPSKPIGIRKDQKFEIVELPISQTYKFFLYTDGIVELETENLGQVDEAKIVELIVFCKNFSIKDTIEEIFSYIKGLKEAKVKDDFVILGFRVRS